jgi:TPP-dependent pyruvate/acetoin dehydrogenase alpha subunit
VVIDSTLALASISSGAALVGASVPCILFWMKLGSDQRGVKDTAESAKRASAAAHAAIKEVRTEQSKDRYDFAKYREHVSEKYATYNVLTAVETRLVEAQAASEKRLEEAQAASEQRLIGAITQMGEKFQLSIQLAVASAKAAGGEPSLGG